jgi:RimJ/RimL family protein N-acetyltransferase
MNKEIKMNLSDALFEGTKICLGAIDHEKDPEIESRWTHESEYLCMLDLALARPLAPAQVKKYYEKIEKEAEEQKNLFYFTIRSRDDNQPGRLLGFIRLFYVEWNHRVGYIQLGIGDASDRGCGYGSEALKLMLRYAFGELNLFHLSANIPEYNPAALHLFAQAGFVEEVRRRQALNRQGRRWDLLQFGLLSSEWQHPAVA